MENRAAEKPVTDSTDWLGTPLSALTPVDLALRCHICKEFYNAPMLTSCNHTFCSLCIRRALATDGKCPLCRANDQESKLRGNHALREAVEAFEASRTSLLEFATTQSPPRSSPSPPKRKVDRAEDLESDSHPQLSKRPRMSTRASKTRAAETTTAMLQEEVLMAERNGPAGNEPADGLVACPICSARMKPWQVDKHLDTSCPSSSGTKAPTAYPSNSTHHGLFGQIAALGPSATPRLPEKLTPLNYSILRDQSLRKKMSELGLSTSGSRQLLENRHKEWVTIWNANCDYAHPKTRAELLQDLGVWERTQGALAYASLHGAQIRAKNFDGAAWAMQHDSSFKDLIASARRSKLISAEKTTGETGLPKTDPPTPDEANPISGLPQTTIVIDDDNSNDDNGINGAPEPPSYPLASSPAHLVKEVAPSSSHPEPHLSPTGPVIQHNPAPNFPPTQS